MAISRSPSALESRRLYGPETAARWFVLICFLVVSCVYFSNKLIASEQSVSPETTELTSLRSQYERRLRALSSPIKEEFLRQTGDLLDRLLRVGRPREALTVQRYVDACRNSDEIPAAPADAPPELLALHREFSERWAAARRTAQNEYGRNLEALRDAYIRRKNPEGATATALLIEDLKSSDTQFVEVNWAEDRRKVRYDYETKKFFKGRFDYSDSNRRKLTDGIVGDAPSENTVAWAGISTQRIRFEFPRVVRPRTVRLYMMGGRPDWKIEVSPEIRVRAGNILAQAVEIGRLRNPVDRTGWIEVPLKAVRGERVFWIEIDTSKLNVVLEEVEFR